MLRVFRFLRSPKPSTSEIALALKALGFEVAYSPGAATSSGPSTSSKESKLLRNLPSPEDVRQRYRKLARLYHPDVSSGDSQRMQNINAAYELLQSSGALRATPSMNSGGNAGGEKVVSKRSSSMKGSRAASFREHQQQRRSRRAVPDDFANGDDLSWTLKGSMEWRAMVSSVDHIRPEELQNPANHPLSHSKFFSLEEDATIYRMLRSGATVSQVARTLGKQATFIEKRLHNAQFKLRVQYLLRAEKKHEAQEAHKQEGSKNSKKSSSFSPSPGSGKWNLRSSFPAKSGPNMTTRVVRQSPSESFPSQDDWNTPLSSTSTSSASARKPVWEPTIPRWRDQSYYANMTLEEKAQYDEILPPYPEEGQEEEANVSKMGRSYANYSRLFGRSDAH